jgi:hypothetical protein
MPVKDVAMVASPDDDQHCAAATKAIAMATYTHCGLLSQFD